MTTLLRATAAIGLMTLVGACAQQRAEPVYPQQPVAAEPSHGKFVGAPGSRARTAGGDWDDDDDVYDD